MTVTKIGIITYHAAYNFGSVLQAYALQEKIGQLGYDCKIINYRMDEQKRYYSNFRYKFGKKRLLEDVTFLPIIKKKLKRANIFEDFFDSFFVKTEQFSNPDDFVKISSEFDVCISGSDQIWNKHSCELNWNEWRFMKPYLLSEFTGMKISYGSSIGNMDTSEISMLIDDLKSFTAVSMREPSSSKVMSSLLNKNIPWVVDPTFLLCKDEWIKKLQLCKCQEKPYVLYYSLAGYKENLRRIRKLDKYAKHNNFQLKVITPYVYIPTTSHRISHHIECGPVEFMNLIYNAKIIITDSYHGTILSVNLEKNFYSICGQNASDFRKTDILEKIGLRDRVIKNINEISREHQDEIDYKVISSQLDIFRKNSVDYISGYLDCV